MATESFSRSCSSFCSWSGGLCDVTFASDSFDTTRSTSRARSCEFGDGGASLDLTIFNTICQFGVHDHSVEVENLFHSLPLRASWVDPILNLTGSPFALPTAYIGLFACLNGPCGLPPDRRDSVYRFICGEAGNAARIASGFRHDGLAIRVTVKVVTFVESHGPVPDDEEEALAFWAETEVWPDDEEEELVFWEETEAGPADEEEESVFWEETEAGPADEEEESVFWEETEVGPGEGACAVCLEEMEEGKTVARLRCGHAFDKSCISRWLERSMRCPLCRSDVEEIV